MSNVRFLTILLAIFAFSAVADHKVATDGSPNMFIVYNPRLQPQVQRYDGIYKSKNNSLFAAKRLAAYLKEITGATFAIMPEDSWTPEYPAFVIGDTHFARSNGIDFRNFKPEEYLYKSIGSNIVIGGGFNFGQMIAIHKLLEDRFNCRYLAHDAKHFPKQKTAVIKAIDKRGEPSFSRRDIYSVNQSQKIGTRLLEFHRFNRGTIHAPGANIHSRQFPQVHSIYRFVDPDVYFKTHSEYFSMDAKGKRFHGDAKRSVGGEICYSNPAVAEIATAQLRKFIAADRKNTPKELWPTLYNINHADSTNYLCYCPECKAITQREGSEAGLLLTFINRVANAIAKDHPEITIGTSAYVSTEKAPRYIKPAKNVAIEYCDLYFRSDCFRPLTHPINHKQLAVFNSWKEKNIPITTIYDYWNMGGRWYFPPHVDTVAPTIKKDLQLFYNAGIRRFFTEAEHLFYEVDGNFYELQLYLAVQLLDDITKDDKALTDEFIKLYYGDGAKYVSQVYYKLAAAINDCTILLNCGNFARPYQTPAFMNELYTLLKKAQATVKNNSPYQLRIERELLPVLRTMLYYDNLRGKLAKAELLKEYRKLRIRQINYLYTPLEAKKLLPKVEDEIAKVSFEFATPKKFAHLPADEIHKFSAIDFHARSHVKDAQSPLKTVVRVGKYHDWKQTAEIHTKPNNPSHGKSIYGVTNQTHKKTKTINVEKPSIPQDEKYHWYCIRNVELGAQTVFWGWGWWTNCRLDKAYLDGADNRWDVWFSLKIVGPAYVKNSHQENNMFLECVIMTKPNAVK